MTDFELEALINGGNIEECIIAFLGMPEAERKKLGRAAVARLRALGKGITPRLAQVMDADGRLPDRAHVGRRAGAACPRWQDSPRSTSRRCARRALA
jgi:hypothetical protein